MIYRVNISTDSLRICEGKKIEAKSSMEAVLTALHHETSAYKHLRDLPMARLRIDCCPAAVQINPEPRTLNQEAGNA